MRLQKKSLFVFSLIVLALFPYSLRAAELPADSATLLPNEKNNNRFSMKPFYLPVAVMIIGALGTIQYKKGLNHEIQKNFIDKKRCAADNYLRFLPSVSYLFLRETGITPKHSFKERSAVFLTSHALMLGLGYGLKAVVHEERPDASGNHSFPSGHVALSFTGAELLREEYGTYCGLAGYATATSVAFLRVYNNKHWLNDVVMGAGIGILSARLVYALLPWERKLFHWEQKAQLRGTAVSVMPQCDFRRKMVGVSVFACF